MTSLTVEPSSPSNRSGVSTAPSNRTRWLARILTGIAILFLAMDTGVKLIGAKVAVDSTMQFGYGARQVLTLGMLELICLLLYLLPRTATLGLVLLTGYLGGASASNMRLELPLVSHVLFPTYVAALLSGGLYLRDARVRKFFCATGKE